MWNVGGSCGYKSIKIYFSPKLPHVRVQLYLDTVFAGSSYNFPSIKLQASDGVVVVNGVKYTTSPEVPNLDG